MRFLKKLFWRLVYHKHEWRGFMSKYGCTCWCVKCGKSDTMMDAYPWGD